MIQYELYFEGAKRVDGSWFQFGDQQRLLKSGCMRSRKAFKPPGRSDEDQAQLQYRIFLHGCSWTSLRLAYCSVRACFVNIFSDGYSSLEQSENCPFGVHAMRRQTVFFYSKNSFGAKGHVALARNKMQQNESKAQKRDDILWCSNMALEHFDKS